MSNEWRAQITLDTEDVVGSISPTLFGGFIEHLGRCVYEGVYDPASELADEDGLRSDVRAALEELNFSVIRYPGGNFVSGYRWRDGVGPVAERPRIRDLAWQTIEPNRFGTNDFIRLCRKIGAEPMLGLNFGTGTLEDAADLVEYCNAPVGTRMADLRAAHGWRDPHAVRYWCLGNEMDGPWQIGKLDAAAYAVKAREAAKLMRIQDPSIRLTLCGSSGPGMPTYPEWDRQVLDLAWEETDYLSLHYYADNRADDFAAYMGTTVQFEEHVDALAGLLRYMKAKQRSRHEVRLAWDEWNVWYRATDGNGGWSEAPHLLEEPYNLEDALVVAMWMNVFLRRCDVLQVACLAQAVNVIAPILTDRNRLVKQTIYHPFRMFRRHARGDALAARVTAPALPAGRYGEVPVLDVAACRDGKDGGQAVFLVNRHPAQAVRAELLWRGAVPSRIEAVHRLSGSDPKAANTFENPDAVNPSLLPGFPVEGGRATVDVPPMSFTVLTAR